MTEPKHPNATKNAGSREPVPERASPYPLSRLAPKFDLVNAAREIADADARLSETTHGKLAVILEQVRFLQAQAQAIVEEARASRDLHRAECKFKRVPGRTYHLYRRPNGALYFSMLSPAEWGGSPPHSFEGSFRLEADMTYTPEERVAARDRDRDAIAAGRLLAANFDER